MVTRTCILYGIILSKGSLLNYKCYKYKLQRWKFQIVLLSFELVVKRISQSFHSPMMSSMDFFFHQKLKFSVVVENISTLILGMLLLQIMCFIVNHCHLSVIHRIDCKDINRLISFSLVFVVYRSRFCWYVHVKEKDFTTIFRVHTYRKHKIRWISIRNSPETCSLNSF